MTSKERVLTTLSCASADRVPIDYDANPGVDARLKAHFGLKPDDGEGLRRVLGVDFRGVGASYVGPRQHEDIDEHQIKVDDWGIHRRWIEHRSGGYWDVCDFPLREADEEKVARWPMPDPDKHDYSGVLIKEWQPDCEIYVFEGGNHNVHRIGRDTVLVNNTIVNCLEKHFVKKNMKGKHL